MGQAPWVLFACDFSGFMGCICRADISSQGWKQLLADGWARLTLCLGWAAGHPGADSLQTLGGL